jgi:hypothetical protein
VSRYRPYAAAFAALHRRRLAQAGPVMIPGHIVQAMIAARCADGEHQAETDEETGDEVCRFCGIVVDDYTDVLEAWEHRHSTPTIDPTEETP